MLCEIKQYSITRRFMGLHVWCSDLICNNLFRYWWFPGYYLTRFSAMILLYPLYLWNVPLFRLRGWTRTMPSWWSSWPSVATWHRSASTLSRRSVRRNMTDTRNISVSWLPSFARPLKHFDCQWLWFPSCIIYSPHVYMHQKLLIPIKKIKQLFLLIYSKCCFTHLMYYGKTYTK